MPAGRPADGLGHVQRLDGDDASKHRLWIVLSTLMGALTVAEACARLGVSESRFHELRRQALEGALESLVPGVPGRPARQADTDATGDRVAELERENKQLRIELQAAYVRTELALGMPHVLTSRAKAEIKKNARRARRSKDDRSDGGGSGT